MSAIGINCLYFHISQRRISTLYGKGKSKQAIEIYEMNAVKALQFIAIDLRDGFAGA